MSYGYGGMPNQNFGMNNGYNPYQMSIDRINQQMQQYQQQQNNNQVVQQPQTNMDFIKVANMQQAKEWVVQNNQSVWMQDSSEPYLYYKSVDNLGSANFRILKVDDVTDVVLNGANQQNVVSQANYVPIEKFNELQSEVNILNERLNIYENMFNVNQQKAPIIDVEPKEIKSVGRPKSNSSSQKVGD